MDFVYNELINRMANQAVHGKALIATTTFYIQVGSTKLELPLHFN